MTAPTRTYLLTPGPLTVPAEIKAEMLVDRSPNASPHTDMTQAIRRYLLGLCNGADTHESVLIQGSATYGIEAGLHTLVPRETSRILVIENGFYGRRLREIAQGARFSVASLELPMLPLPTAADIEAALDADPGITHIILCHAETGTGVLNPVGAIAEVVHRRCKQLMIDAVASFGGFPIDAKALDPLAIFISPNKCLEAVPGVAAIIARRRDLEAAAGRSPSVVLDLHAQWRFMEDTHGGWRWTPPTHVVAALAKGCERHAAEGLEGRQARYRRNWRRLVDSLRQRGFRTLLPDETAAPIIATFHDPDDANYTFQAFYDAMTRRGFIIFPGRLTAAGTFRIGLMGDLGEEDVTRVIEAIDGALTEIGVNMPAGAA